MNNRKLCSFPARRSSDLKSIFSNYGTWIDISAPGTYIASTFPNNQYGFMSGTSMATPLVSGLLGLMKSYDSTISNSDLIQCLRSEEHTSELQSRENLVCR